MITKGIVKQAMYIIQNSESEDLVAAVVHPCWYDPNRTVCNNVKFAYLAYDIPYPEVYLGALAAAFIEKNGAGKYFPHIYWPCSLFMGDDNPHVGCFESSDVPNLSGSVTSINPASKRDQFYDANSCNVVNGPRLDARILRWVTGNNAGDKKLVLTHTCTTPPFIGFDSEFDHDIQVGDTYTTDNLDLVIPVFNVGDGYQTWDCTLNCLCRKQMEYLGSASGITLSMTGIMWACKPPENPPPDFYQCFDPLCEREGVLPMAWHQVTVTLKSGAQLPASGAAEEYGNGKVKIQVVNPFTMGPPLLRSSNFLSYVVGGLVTISNSPNYSGVFFISNGWVDENNPSIAYIIINIDEVNVYFQSENMTTAALYVKWEYLHEGASFCDWIGEYIPNPESGADPDIPWQAVVASCIFNPNPPYNTLACVGFGNGEILCIESENCCDGGTVEGSLDLEYCNYSTASWSFI